LNEKELRPTTQLKLFVISCQLTQTQKGLFCLKVLSFISPEKSFKRQNVEKKSSA
jgi:hypothetical protein